METSCLVIRGEGRAASDSKYTRIICQSVGKPFPSTRDAVLFPHFDQLRIKRIDRLSGGRYSLQVKGVPRKYLLAGSVIIAGGQLVYRSRVGYGISRRRIPAGTYSMRGGLFREHGLPGTVTITPAAGGYHLSASADLPLALGGRYRLEPVSQPDVHPATGAAPSAGKLPAALSLRPQRGALPHELLLCLPCEPPPDARRRMRTVLEQLGREVSMPRIAGANFELLGWAGLPAQCLAVDIAEVARSFETAGSEQGNDRTAEVKELLGEDGARLVLLEDFRARLSSDLIKAVKRSGGAKAEAVYAQLKHPVELVRAVAEQLQRDGYIVRRSGILLLSGPNAGLSPMEKGVLESLRERFEQSGFVRSGKGAERKVLQHLVDLHLAEQVGERYCPSDTYRELAGRLLQGRNPGEAISVSYARQILKLPREQVVGFLESLDTHGVLRRDRTVHRVVRGLERIG